MTMPVSLATQIALGWLLKVDQFAMPNIIANKTVVPEMFQKEATAENLHREAAQLMDPARLAEMREGLAEATAKLGGEGASVRAARKLIEVLDK